MRRFGKENKLIKDYLEVYEQFKDYLKTRASRRLFVSLVAVGVRKEKV